MCPNCEREELRTIYALEGSPIHSVVLLDTREEARSFPRGDITLGYCSHCGFLSNQTYDPQLQDYSSRYESTQSFSPTFNRFNRELAERLVQSHDLNGKDVLEIGCGQGEFLTLLCEIGGNRGTGFDPAYTGPSTVAGPGFQMRFVTDYFSEAYADREADFVCCKMTLEHIPDTRRFLSTVREAINPERDPVIFFQVPDTLRILRETAFWDIYYEHCSYFTAPSLEYLFQSLGFEVLCSSSEYDGQYLLIEARLGNGQAGEDPGGVALSDVASAVEFFSTHAAERIARWKDLVLERAQGRQPAVIWGGGSKGVAFLTTLGIQDQIQYAVDINPRKENTYLPGSGQRIVMPGFLTGLRPATIFVMNPIYLGEIQATLDELQVRAELIPLA